MARKKVKLAWIANDSARRATFKKRRKGLMKKVSELSTLCDVKACAIVYGPDEPHPQAWPSLQEATRVVTRFKTMPEVEQAKKMMDQESFLRHQAAKVQEQLRKQERDCRELETTLLMYQVLGGLRGIYDMNIDMIWALVTMAEGKMKTVQDKMERFGPQDLGQTDGMALHQQTGNQLEMAMAMQELQGQNWYNDLLNPNPNPNPNLNLNPNLNEAMVYAGAAEELMMQGYMQTNPTFDGYYWN